LSRHEIVYKALRKAIFDQAITPGTKLTEDVIARSFEVSRTVVRTALSRLAAEGLVDIRMNHGASVAEPTLQEARDIFAMRRHLERLVTDALSGKLDVAKRRRLEEVLDADHNMGGSQSPDAIQVSADFHVVLAEMTGNRILARFVDEMVARSALILALYARPHSAECSEREHRAILDALTADDREKAARLMEEHLTAVASRAMLDDADAPSLQKSLQRYSRHFLASTDE
jgi:DNA-binding GntR family transcriptional regulator